MRALIVVESYFDSTRTIANQIAQGLGDRGCDTQLLCPQEAGGIDLTGTDLLVLGAPTHNRGLPTPRSRIAAAERGGTRAASGIREWLGSTQLPQAVGLAVFDTVTGRSWLNGSAAKQIVKNLGRRGAPVRSFLVNGEHKLVDGQVRAARVWGADLAQV